MKGSLATGKVVCETVRREDAIALLSGRGTGKIGFGKRSTMSDQSSDSREPKTPRGCGAPVRESPVRETPFPESPFPESQFDEMPSGEPVPVQYSLRSLLLVVTLCSVLFAVVTTVNTMWAAMVVLTVVMALAHVAAAVIATRALAVSSDRERHLSFDGRDVENRDSRSTPPPPSRTVIHP